MNRRGRWRRRRRLNKKRRRKRKIGGRNEIEG
jgi:hypothetical protein